MKERILPDSLLQGEYFHCRPTEDSPTVKVKIISVRGESIKRLCVCGARSPCSKCSLRKDSTDNYCHYWRGDGLPDGYAIVGPRAYEKSDRGWSD